MTLPFVMPPPVPFKNNPQWNGSVFLIDGQEMPILEYSENFAGWSDDLTNIHEAVVGSDHPIDVASRIDAINQVKSVLKSNTAKKVILEIGCSSGYLLKDLKANFPDSDIIGADVIKEPLLRLATSMKGIPLIRFDILKCPLPPESVDVLIMLNVLEHIEDDVEALRQAYKLIKPGGGIILEVPAFQILYDSYDKELHHFRRYSSSDLVRKLKKNNFAIQRKSHLAFAIFPLYSLVKLVNKFRKKQEVFKKQAASTSNNKLLRKLLSIEGKYLGSVKLPFGIRVLITARKGL